MNHVQALSRGERRAAAKYLQAENAKWPAHLVPMPTDGATGLPPGLSHVLRSRDYLVQVFAGEGDAAVRLSINRTAITQDGGWAQDIPWEDLQRLKNEAGYAHCDAVEVYPRASDVVNVANMRHLWVMARPLEFAWRKA